LGALLEMCCTFVPVLTRTFARLSSQRRPAVESGSNPSGWPFPPRKNIVSSVTSPKKPEKRSIRVTPG
jgi:hypothetical protein